MTQAPHLIGEKNTAIRAGLVTLGVIIVIGILYVIFRAFFATPDMLGNVHKHADFKVYLLGVPYNFSQEKYMSNEEHTLSPFFHLHDMDGEVLHQHIKGMMLGNFFTSLGVQFNSTCFVLDTGEEYCNNDLYRLKMYVNGDRYYQYNTYEFRDLDRILLTYGNETDGQIELQMLTVGDRACIFSESCPERGSPPNESSCVGQGNCDI